MVLPVEALRVGPPVDHGGPEIARVGRLEAGQELLPDRRGQGRGRAAVADGDRHPGVVLLLQGAHQGVLALRHVEERLGVGLGGRIDHGPLRVHQRRGDAGLLGDGEPGGLDLADGDPVLVALPVRGSGGDGQHLAVLHRDREASVLREQGAVDIDAVALGVGAVGGVAVLRKGGAPEHHAVRQGGQSVCPGALGEAQGQLGAARFLGGEALQGRYPQGLHVQVLALDLVPVLADHLEAGRRRREAVGRQLVQALGIALPRDPVAGLALVTVVGGGIPVLAVVLAEGPVIRPQGLVRPQPSARLQIEVRGHDGIRQVQGDPAAVSGPLRGQDLGGGAGARPEDHVAEPLALRHRDGDGLRLPF